MSDEMIERVARAICLSQGQTPDDLAPLTMICGPNDEQIPYWNYYEEHARAAISAMQRDSFAVVPLEPTQGVLVSMATCLDHGFGAPSMGQLDYRTMDGRTLAEYQQSTLYEMRKLYDEVVGQGYWKPEREDSYVRLLAPVPAHPHGGADG